MEDSFYNGANKHYEGNSIGPAATHFTVDFQDPGEIKPPNKIWVGRAVYGTNSYNCLTDDAFEYTDDKYGKCYSYARCVQKDALQVAVSASKDSIRVSGLPPANEIYAHLSERYNDATHTCDPTPVDLGVQGCKVHFVCNDNNAAVAQDPAVLPALREQMTKFGATALFTTEVVNEQVMNAGCTPACWNTVERTYRTMPTFAQIIARAIPQDNSRFGYEVSRMEAHIKCDPDPGNEALCGALGSVFSLLGMLVVLRAVDEPGRLVYEGFISQELLLKEPYCFTVVDAFFFKQLNIQLNHKLNDMLEDIEAILRSSVYHASVNDHSHTHQINPQGHPGFLLHYPTAAMSLSCFEHTSPSNLKLHLVTTLDTTQRKTGLNGLGDVNVEKGKLKYEPFCMQIEEGLVQSHYNFLGSSKASSRSYVGSKLLINQMISTTGPVHTEAGVTHVSYCGPVRDGLFSCWGSGTGGGSNEGTALLGSSVKSGHWVEDQAARYRLCCRGRCPYSVTTTQATRYPHFAAITELRILPTSAKVIIRPKYMLVGNGGGVNSASEVNLNEDKVPHRRLRSCSSEKPVKGEWKLKMVVPPAPHRTHIRLYGKGSDCKLYHHGTRPFWQSRAEPADTNPSFVKGREMQSSMLGYGIPLVIEGGFTCSSHDNKSPSPPNGYDTHIWGVTLPLIILAISFIHLSKIASPSSISDWVGVQKNTAKPELRGKRLNSRRSKGHDEGLKSTSRSFADIRKQNQKQKMRKGRESATLLSKMLYFLTGRNFQNAYGREPENYQSSSRLEHRLTTCRRPTDDQTGRSAAQCGGAPVFCGPTNRITRGYLKPQNRVKINNTKHPSPAAYEICKSCRSPATISHKKIIGSTPD
ncbi:uncharacterized protein BDR25DRAFT_361500 [Lindgomyces ingoldianus]|uniref:Uncharacterized protein n=1 Tax=Lindgomyces ingoldianus TaxID=673940 RepID=A0ACB6QBT1_9PLEO|nr:uncharacterized protein BDR25DRAFT_361500 [Lindgomyces ingoldianus]KAF2464428.1 hypothetical protein BDR25DRAFT_361500 [Lindgomyces ingoldianus]